MSKYKVYGTTWSRNSPAWHEYPALVLNSLHNKTTGCQSWVGLAESGEGQDAGTCLTSELGSSVYILPPASGPGAQWAAKSQGGLCSAMICFKFPDTFYCTKLHLSVPGHTLRVKDAQMNQSAFLIHSHSFNLVKHENINHLAFTLHLIETMGQEEMAQVFKSQASFICWTKRK